MLRRAGDPSAQPRTLSYEGLHNDAAAHEVRCGDELVHVTPRQFELLRTLASDPVRVFTKAELLQSIWGYEDASATRTLSSHAWRLRQVLAAHGRPGLVRGQRGVGYRLAPRVSPPRARSTQIARRHPAGG